jgi:hypothetical protein
MNRKKAQVERCVFCNSLSHKMENCNSNMNGRREYLDQGWDCMMHVLCPDFKLLHANELRYVAYHYVQYTGAVHSSDCKTSQHYNRKYGLSPIPLSLSKKKMVNELDRRWHAFSEIRELSTNPPPEQPDDDCPICLESMTSYKWSNNTSCWKLQTDKKFTTRCNHSFCRSCFDTHIEKNSIRDRYLDERIMCVGCPYCRTKLYYE